MVWILALVTIFGFNFTTWLVIGVVRFFHEKLSRRDGLKKNVAIHPISIKEVAALLPAHNEELTIKETLEALLRILPAENIYVANDYSTDKTSEIAKSMGVNVNDIDPNLGKARALVATLKHFDMYNRYKAVLINDADVEVDEQYLARAIPLLEDTRVACVAGHQENKYEKIGLLENLFIFYRIRLWRMVQFGMRFGQTWKFTNVLYIIPGAISIYKTPVLKQLEIDAPGLIIEDFNMTFEVHKKRLGRIAYSPQIKGYHQDPYTFTDYVKQIKRWNLGFWQTVRRHGIWPSMFCLFTAGFIAEVLMFALFLLAVPVMGAFWFHDMLLNTMSVWRLTWFDLFVGLFAADYLLTIIVAVVEKKPLMLLYGPLFFLLRFVDAFVLIFTIPLTFTTTSRGVWKSPKRKSTGALAV